MEVVVLMGEPGSGKSTVARELKKQIRKSKAIEASRIIYLVSLFYADLPNSADLLLRKIKARNSRTSQIKVSRAKARAIASKLQTKYSKDFVARALEYIYVNSSNKLLIIAGLRGYDNAKYFKNKDYLVVFLKAKRSVLIKRLIQKYNYSTDMASAELEEENELHSTRRIEKMADIVVDTSSVKPAESALNIVNYLKAAGM